MTATTTEPTETPGLIGPGAPPSTPGPRMPSARPAYSVGLTAALSWVAGAAAQSWHLSVPFLAGWAVLLGVVLLSAHLTGIVGAAWHREKIAATPELVALTKLAEVMGESAAKKYLANKGINL